MENEGKQLPDWKVKAFQRRQKDQGWGYAVGQILTPIGLYYAITRRTLTPIAYDVIGSLLIGFFVPTAYSNFAPTLSIEQITIVSWLASIAATPLLAKTGIDNARDFAKQQLESHNISARDLNQENSAK